MTGAPPFPIGPTSSLCRQNRAPGAFSKYGSTFSTAARHSAGAAPFVSRMSNLMN